MDMFLNVCESLRTLQIGGTMKISCEIGKSLATCLVLLLKLECRSNIFPVKLSKFKITRNYLRKLSTPNQRYIFLISYTVLHLYNWRFLLHRDCERLTQQ